jgi:hypothetical protein
VTTKEYAEAKKAKVRQMDLPSEQREDVCKEIDQATTKREIMSWWIWARKSQ